MGNICCGCMSPLANSIHLNALEHTHVLCWSFWWLYVTSQHRKRLCSPISSRYRHNMFKEIREGKKTTRWHCGPLLCGCCVFDTARFYSYISHRMPNKLRKLQHIMFAARTATGYLTELDNFFVFKAKHFTIQMRRLEIYIYVLQTQLCCFAS